MRVDDDAVSLSSLSSDDVRMMSLLESAQTSSPVCLTEMTKILLDRSAHPPGSLSWDVLDASFPVLHAWAKTHTVVGAQTAQEILERLHLEERYRNQLVTPKHYGVLVDACAKSNHPQAAQRAEEMLAKMQQPNRVAYNAAMSAWARQGNVREAERLFQKMPSHTTQDYNTLLAAHAKCGNARQAESLLRDMVTSSSEKVAPDIVSYNCVLDAWAKSTDEGAAERAFAILQSLPGADARSYFCVASAFVKKGDLDRVQALLDEACDRGIELDAYLQNSLLEAFAMEGEATRAQEYLDEMEQEGVANSVSYNIVIKAWKRSGASNAADQAEEILDRMVARQLDDVVTYTSVVSIVRGNLLLAQKSRSCSYLLYLPYIDRSTATPKANSADPLKRLNSCWSG
jgi:pentatricopeptide repeat protein